MDKNETMQYLDVVVEDARKKLVELKCDYIYLASEEKRIVDYFEKNFPGKILTNQRHYYDEQYYNLCTERQSDVWIGDIFAGSEELNYVRGMEYLSSIVLLSACTELWRVGGGIIYELSSI
ncbi:MAG: hypothetical protein NC311_08355 [Muribaculaceae bacterium]|nr:hypothetical protein [Muribaculaceae bacterium]MCM1398948.1 hypothetical protein [Clostridium sp.]MCM1458806.1 hypothetical protein [Bacteroides sp.]